MVAAHQPDCLGGGYSSDRDKRIACPLLVIWGVYNMQRFRGKERRTHVHPVEVSTMANYFIVDPVQLVEWQQEKNLVIHIDELGMIRSVEKRTLAMPEDSGQV